MLPETQFILIKIEKVAFVAMVPPALSIMCPLPSLFTQRMGTKSEKNTF